MKLEEIEQAAAELREDWEGEPGRLWMEVSLDDVDALCAAVRALRAVYYAPVSGNEELWEAAKDALAPFTE